VQEALEKLDSDGAIARVFLVRPDGRKQRVIYPATTLLHAEVTPTVGVGGHPQHAGVHNLIQRARPPKTELARARLAAKLQEKREASERGKVVGCPSSEAPSDGEGTSLTDEAAVGMSRHAAGQLVDVNGGGLRAAKLSRSTPTLTEQSAPDDGTPAFLRRKAKGARDRTPDAGGMASDRAITEEEGDWRL
jgi:hypothetical protein